jgi:hypothetical protein
VRMSSFIGLMCTEVRNVQCLSYLNKVVNLCYVKHGNVFTTLSFLGSRPTHFREVRFTYNYVHDYFITVVCGFQVSFYYLFLFHHAV